MFLCPNCQERLLRTQNKVGIHWACSRCQGRAVSVPLLRKVVAREYVNHLWAAARDGKGVLKRRCPACERKMLEVEVPTAKGIVKLDVCRVCEFVWFDQSEFETTPAAPLPAPVKQDIDHRRALPQEAREKLAIYEARLLAEQNRDATPDAGWKTVPAALGFPVELETKPLRFVPRFTLTLAALMVLVSLSAFTDLDEIIQNFGLIPAQAWRYGGATWITSFFLHGGFWHLLGNLYFLVVFGSKVEDFLGWQKLFVLVLSASVAGDSLHVLGEPRSDIPCIGASAGISGILAYYAMKFPRERLGVLFRCFWLMGYVRWLQLPAWGVFFLWIGLQLLGSLRQLSGFGSVSALSHVGGAVVGVALWLRWRRQKD